MRAGQQPWWLDEAVFTSGRDGARASPAAAATVIFPYPRGILRGDATQAHLPADTGWRLIEMGRLHRALKSEGGRGGRHCASRRRFGT